MCFLCYILNISNLQKFEVFFDINKSQLAKGELF